MVFDGDFLYHSITVIKITLTNNEITEKNSHFSGCTM
jgi:hypothetical protein